MEFVFHASVTKELFCVLCAALLLTASAEEGAYVKTPQCHNYAGGHVYPGEAFRVPVSDHSLHLSKAKSEFSSRLRPQVPIDCRSEVRSGSPDKPQLQLQLLSEDNRKQAACVTARLAVLWFSYQLSGRLV